jgi:hypothetical protein
VPILTENPRGVVLVRDELAGWVLAMNQYREGGKGADQQFWLSAWSGANVTVDRKGTHAAGPLRVRHPFVGVVGCRPARRGREDRCALRILTWPLRSKRPTRATRSHGKQEATGQRSKTAWVIDAKVVRGKDNVGRIRLPAQPPLPQFASIEKGTEVL